MKRLFATLIIIVFCYSFGYLDEDLLVVYNTVDYNSTK